MGLRRMKLSVIDQAPVPSGFTPAAALQNTIALARLTDRLGYERYWMAEHHARLKEKDPDQYLVRLGLLIDFITDYLQSSKS